MVFLKWLLCVLEWSHIFRNGRYLPVDLDHFISSGALVCSTPRVYLQHLHWNGSFCGKQTEFSVLSTRKPATTASQTSALRCHFKNTIPPCRSLYNTYTDNITTIVRGADGTRKHKAPWQYINRGDGFLTAVDVKRMISRPRPFAYQILIVIIILRTRSSDRINCANANYDGPCRATLSLCGLTLSRVLTPHTTRGIISFLLKRNLFNLYLKTNRRPTPPRRHDDFGKRTSWNRLRIGHENTFARTSYLPRETGNSVVADRTRNGNLDFVTVVVYSRSRKRLLKRFCQTLRISRARRNVEAVLKSPRPRH